MTQDKSLLIIDNFDSFTYNLVHLFKPFVKYITVVHPSQFFEPGVYSKHYDRIILSPGPGLPSEIPDLMNVIHYAIEKNIPLLGVCLGHQAIAEYFGAQLFRREHPLHGQEMNMQIIQPDSILFRSLPSKFQVGLYHSWAILPSSLSDELIVTAISAEGIIMAFEHNAKPIFGVQFHPESYITMFGSIIARNFIFLS